MVVLEDRKALVCKPGMHHITKVEGLNNRNDSKISNNERLRGEAVVYLGA